MSNLIEFRKQLINQGGATYSLNTGELNPEDGYFVAIEGREFKVPFADSNVIAEFCKANIDLLLLPNHFLGGWYFELNFYLDVSQKVEIKSEAIKLGRERNQIAIWDANNDKEIKIKK